MSAESDEQASNYVRHAFAPEALNEVPVADRVEDIAILRHALGRFRIVGSKEVAGPAGMIIVENGHSGRLQEINVEVEGRPPYRLTKVGETKTLSGLPTNPRNDAQRVRMLEEFVARLAGTGSFSGSVLLARDRKIIFERAFGMAEKRFDVRNTPETRFYLGSITKSFTAVAIGQLVDQGKVSWNDPLAKSLKDFPSAEAARKIQIRHLLTHTSGLTNTPYPPGRPVPHQSASLAALVAAAPRNPVLAEPGATYLYNNLGFLLLGRVVEIASGQDFYSYIREHVLDPAGMTSTGMDRYDSVKVLAYAYERLPTLNNDQVVDGRLFGPARAVPFGGAYGTAKDMWRFDQALTSGKLVSPATLQVMTTMKPELKRRGGYGFGLENNEFASAKGRKVIQHGGNAVGACTWWIRILDSEVPYTFVVLSNSGQTACYPVTEYIFNLLPAKLSREPLKAISRQQLTTE